MRNALLTAVVLVAVTAATAAAETKAWETVKRRLPGKLMAVTTADVDQLRTSAVIQTLLPELTTRHPHARTAIERTKGDCGIDLTTAVNGLVLAMGDDERGVVVISRRRGVGSDRVGFALRA